MYVRNALERLVDSECIGNCCAADRTKPITVKRNKGQIGARFEHVRENFAPCRSEALIVQSVGGQVRKFASGILLIDHDTR